MPVQQRTVALSPENIRTVERFARRIGLESFSAALRIIIHNFDHQEKQPAKKRGQGEDQPAEPISA